jgi:hypothetical protein
VASLFKMVAARVQFPGCVCQFCESLRIQRDNRIVSLSCTPVTLDITKTLCVNGFDFPGNITGLGDLILCKPNNNKAEWKSWWFISV